MSSGRRVSTSPTAVVKFTIATRLTLLRLRSPHGMEAHSLDRVLWPGRFATLAAHQPVERGKIRTLPPFGEEGGGIHRCQLFRNGRGDELIYAHAIGLN